MSQRRTKKSMLALPFARSTIFLLALVLSFAFPPLIPGMSIAGVGQVYAGVNYGAKIVSGANIMLGQEEKVMIQIENKTSSQVTIKVKLTGGDDFEISEDISTSYNIEPKAATEIPFDVKAKKTAKTGERELKVYITGLNGATDSVETVKLDVYSESSPASGSVTPAFDMAMTKGGSGIVADEVTKVGFELFNKGNTYTKNTIVSLSLPEGLSIQSGSNSANIGYVMIGDTRRVEFSVIADSETTSKNYPMTLKISGIDNKGSSFTVEQDFYIPVTGGDGGAQSKISNVEISNIAIVDSANMESDFNLSFKVANTQDINIKNARVTVEIPEGLINKTKNVFSIDTLQKGSPQTFNVTLFAPKSDTEKFYPIKIIVEPMNSSSETPTSVSQYTGIYIKKSGASNSSEKTPQLIVSDYSYGGTYVYAGTKFRLNVTTLNASSNHIIRNVKVTITSDDGTFVPVGSSNSYYIDSVDRNAVQTKSLMMSVKPDAEQKTSSLTVTMSYEDEDGNAFTAADIISIPVQQETRLVVDEVAQPPELYAGMEAYASVQFYNMGKTVLNNLRVTASGDFQVSGSKMYFVGNMAAGSNDYYDLVFIPNAGGQMSGVVTFTYEEASGKEVVYEMPLEFTVMEEMPVWDPGMEEGMMEPQGTGISMKYKIAGAVGLLAALIGFLIWRNRRKKKLARQMEIDD